MADSDVSSLRSGNTFIKNSLDFEKDLKLKLKWNRQQWLQAGEQGSRINKLCNSMKYWKDKLKPAMEDTSFVLTLFNPERDIKTDLFDIIDAIENIDADIKVQGFTGFRNPRYLCFYFKNKDERDKVMNEFRMLDCSFVVYLSWAFDNGVNVASLKVHWLPMTLNVDVIKKELDQYVTCVEEARVFLTSLSGRNMASGIVNFKVRVKEGVSVDKIPHVMNIANMETLITISGRAPLCLNCQKLGHISKNCTLRYCNSCEVLVARDHKCLKSNEPKSYAMVVNNTDNSENKVDLDDWNAAIEAAESESPAAVQTLFSDKINILENQIKKLNAQALIMNSTKPDMKRKLDVLLKNQDPELLSEGSQSGSLSEEESSLIGSFQNEFQFSNIKLTEASMNVETVETPELLLGSCAKVNKGKGKKKSKAITNGVLKPPVNTDIDIESSNRSYGKPNLHNRRRKRDEAKYDKLSDVREFVFQD